MEEEFRAWEYGISARYNFYKSLYILAGLLQHSNEGGSSSNSHGTKYASILMFEAGIGFDMSPVTSIELNYYIPTTKQVIGWSRGIDVNGEVNSSFTFESMIRLGFIFAWGL